MDFIGPRYLYTKRRFYAHTIISKDTHFAQADIYDNHKTESACKSIIEFWKIAGVPDFLQMDNAISFWGSLNKPNAFGKVIKLCLHQEVIPVLIPVSEPWRNGVIERFNNTFQSCVLSAQKYEALPQLQSVATKFCNIHNESHHYSTQEGMTPRQRMSYNREPYKRLDNQYEVSNIPLELTEGEVYIIRFIRSDLKFHLFGNSYPLSKEYEYQYVLGIILTGEHKIKIFKEQICIAEFPFILY